MKCFVLCAQLVVDLVLRLFFRRVVLPTCVGNSSLAPNEMDGVLCSPATILCQQARCSSYTAKETVTALLLRRVSAEDGLLLLFVIVTIQRTP